jgi:hypothetical protein
MPLSAEIQNEMIEEGPEYIRHQPYGSFVAGEVDVVAAVFAGAETILALHDKGFRFDLCNDVRSGYKNQTIGMLAVKGPHGGAQTIAALSSTGYVFDKQQDDELKTAGHYAAYYLGTEGITALAATGYKFDDIQDKARQTVAMLAVWSGAEAILALHETGYRYNDDKRWLCNETLGMIACLAGPGAVRALRDCGYYYDLTQTDTNGDTVLDYAEVTTTRSKPTLLKILQQQAEMAGPDAIDALKDAVTAHDKKTAIRSALSAAAGEIAMAAVKASHASDRRPQLRS